MDIKDKIKAVNDKLAGFGAQAVQKKPALGSRPALFGFIPQFCFDCMNSYFAGEWSVAVGNVEWAEKQVVVQVTVTIAGQSFMQYGEFQIIRQDRGNAIKSATTDGIQKCLALSSIGSAAYRGELKAVFNGKVSHVVTEGNPLLGAAKTVKTREDGIIWWQKNLAKIKLLSPENRSEIVAELGKRK